MSKHIVSPSRSAPRNNYLHPLTELLRVATKWVEFDLLRYDSVAMGFMRSNADTVSQGLKLLRQITKRLYISMSTTNENADVERGERKADGLMLGIKGIKSDLGICSQRRCRHGSDSTVRFAFDKFSNLL